jgi:hypothetical protein
LIDINGHPQRFSDFWGEELELIVDIHDCGTRTKATKMSYDELH